MKTVETERLRVRRVSKADLAAFLAYRNDPRSMALQPVEPMPEEAAIRFLARMATVEIGAEGGWLMLAVELKRARRMIGEVGVFLAPQKESLGNLGWSIHPEYQGRGYATEAASILLAYVFEQRGLRRVTANCDVRNVASFRLMERLGMRREGEMRQSKFLNGAWHDEYLYALLREEWLAREKR